MKYTLTIVTDTSAGQADSNARIPIVEASETRRRELEQLVTRRSLSENIKANLAQFHF